VVEMLPLALIHLRVRLFVCLFVCLFVRLCRLSLCALKAEAGYTLSQVLVDVRRQSSPAMCVCVCVCVCVCAHSVDLVCRCLVRGTFP
jgi:hypothetical protein